MLEDLTPYIRSHVLCMQMVLKYLTIIAAEESKNPLAPDYTEQLLKYQTPTPGQSFSGKTWLLWFLNDYMPHYLEKEIHVSNG